MDQTTSSNSTGARWPGPEPTFTLFHWNKTVWEAVLETCAAARQSIELEQYILGTRGIGRQLLDILAERARDGVRVRVLADGFGSRGLMRSDAGRTLLRSGGQILFHNPVPGLRNPLRRLHRKTLICDGSRVMIGGSCFKQRMAEWRDTMIRLDGPVPPALLTTFERNWMAARDGTIKGGFARLNKPAREGWHFAATGPTAPDVPDLGQVLHERIAGARHAVTLTTPYLLPEPSLCRALIAAAAKGVRVRVLMPAKSDHPTVDPLGRLAAAGLARRGIAVHGYRREMLHAKIAVVDDNWCSVSSYNLDLFSGRLNLEGGVVTDSPRLCKALMAQLAADFGNSKPL